MPESEKDSPEVTASAQPEHKEPSLGPACLVVSILTLATFSAVCAFGSWMVFSDQYPLAQKAIEKQLIPWVESSQLAPEDKSSIVQQLEDLVPKLQDQSISKKQLLRLRNCLQDNPVLLWGGVQSIIRQAPGAGLTETEQESLQRISERLLRMAVERSLSRRDMEFTIQELSSVREDGLSLEVNNNLTAEQIRLFMKRAESLLESHNIPNEPYDVTPGEAFGLLVEASLDVDPSLQ